MDSTKRYALIAIGLFLGTVVLVLLYSRGGDLLAPKIKATELAVPDCDLQQQACTVSLPEGGKVTLEFDPHPVWPMKDFSMRLQSDGVEIQKAVISFTGVDMNMGLNRFELKPIDNALAGKAILPICVRNRMEWEGRLRISTSSGVFDAPFRFETYKQ